jgi:predicted nuclease with TOPRIM domain
MPTSNLEIIEQIQFLIGTNRELLGIIEQQQTRINTMNERIERLEYKPTISRGIRQKDIVPVNPHYHWDYVDPRCYK